jgi:glyoxylase-like metal-dependent hydrolase (beta-lactamase superfamily II)
VEDGHPLTTDVWLELTAGHTPGHAIVRVESGGQSAVLLGHLALNPVQVAVDQRAGLPPDGVRAAEVLDQLLLAARDGGTLVIGPLWPAPGAGTVSGPPWRITARSGTARRQPAPDASSQSEVAQ